MRKINVIIVVLSFFTLSVSAQLSVNGGVLFQKTEGLYWENGIGVDVSSQQLLNDKLHLKFNYLSSRLGSAMFSNALRQDNLLVGADWRFRSNKDLQILAGLNTGIFMADYETNIFNDLPASSMLFQVETGLVYRFKFPVTASLTAGYNLISGDGVGVPGSIFPVFYKLSVYYRIK